MKRIFKIIILLLFFTSTVYGQINDIENLMTRRYLSCQDIRYNAQFLIPEFYQNKSNDTLNAIIDYWEKHCGISEEIIRCKILLAIDNHNFNERIYNSNILNYLISYKNNSSILDSNYGKIYVRFNWNYYNNQPDTLDKFTVYLAKVLLKRNDLKPIESFFLRIYSNDFENTFAMLQTEEFNGTIIQGLYNKEIEMYKKKVIGHGDLLLGAWIPQDNLETVGSHPFFGFRYGIQYKKLIADVTIGFKFGKSPKVYQVYENDSIWDTDHFFGGYLGLDMGLEMVKIKNSSFDLIGGIAFDGFDALKADDPNSNDDITKSLNSLNLNVGLGYKYNINPWNYLGVDIKYNILDYKNPRGTDLSGNALTINLIYGFYGNRYSTNRLKDLDYNE